MNTGIIASRYATALLKLVDETGNGETVANQVQRLQKALESVPDLKRAITDEAVITSEEKISLMETALGDEKMAPELRKFIILLIRKDRIKDVALVFSSFVGAYYKSRKIKKGRLVVPSSSDGTRALEDKLHNLVESSTGCKLELETVVDPSIIGGFVFEVEDSLLDASVSHQLDIIRRQFVERNRRIV